MGTITLSGESGNTYTFEIYSLLSDFDEDECVYIYAKAMDIDDEWQPIYVETDLRHGYTWSCNMQE